MFVVPLRTPNFSTVRLTPCLRKIAPLTNDPLGTTTTPPPAAAHLSIADWMALVLTVAASATAPKSEITKRFSAAASDIAITMTNSIGLIGLLLLQSLQANRDARDRTAC